MATLDSYISWQKGKWKINGYESGIKERHLWVKIPSKVNYALNMKKNYLFRLAYAASVML